MKNSKIKTIVVCSSAAFYKQAVDIEKELKNLGFKVLIPLVANKMKKSGDFNVENYKTWWKNPNDYKRKLQLTIKHFKEIEKGDPVLVLNYKKNGKAGYIGGAVLMEIALALYLKKPIYILNPIDESSKYKEEIYGALPKIINGDLLKIK